MKLKFLPKELHFLSQQVVGLLNNGTRTVSPVHFSEFHLPDLKPAMKREHKSQNITLG